MESYLHMELKFEIYDDIFKSMHYKYLVVQGTIIKSKLV